MTDLVDTPLPEQVDGEPDLASEIARLDASLKELRDHTQSLETTTDYDQLHAKLDELLTDEARAAIPSDTSKLDQVFAKITAVLREARRTPKVPETDTQRPPLSPPPADFASLPAHARIAAGYGKA